MTRLMAVTFTLALATVAAGCGRSGTTVINTGGSKTPAAGPSAEGKKYLLNQEPVGGKGVLAVKDAAKDGDDVVVVGRIGGDKKPFTQGRAVFVVLDPSVKFCNEIGDDACETPWDCCCGISAADLAKAKVTVKFADGQGKTLPLDAKSDLGLLEMQTVAVRGKVKKDEKGNMTVLASAVYPTPVPEKKP